MGEHDEGSAAWAIAASSRLASGNGPDEWERSGALRVYEDTSDLRKHLDEVGGRC